MLNVIFSRMEAQAVSKMRVLLNDKKLIINIKHCQE